MLWSTIKSCAPKALKEVFLTFNEFDLWWRERTILGFNDRRMYSLQSRRILQRDRGKCYPFILDVETNGELGESKIDSSCYIMTTDEKGTQSQIVYKQHRSHQNLDMVFVAYWTTDTISDLWVICRVRPCESWARAERCVSVILYQVFTRDVCIQKEA